MSRFNVKVSSLTAGNSRPSVCPAPNNVLIDVLMNGPLNDEVIIKLCPFKFGFVISGKSRSEILTSLLFYAFKLIVNTHMNKTV